MKTTAKALPSSIANALRLPMPLPAELTPMTLTAAESGATGNLVVVAAAVGVIGTGTPCPNLVVAGIMASV